MNIQSLLSFFMTSVSQLRRLEVHTQRVITGIKEVSSLLLDLIKCFAPSMLGLHSRTVNDIEILLRYASMEFTNVANFACILWFYNVN